MNAYNYGPNFTPYGAGQINADALNFGAPGAGAPMQSAPMAVPVPNAPADGLGSQLQNLGVGGVQMQGQAPAGRLGGLWNNIGGMQGLSGLLQGLGGLGQVYASMKGLGLAKEQLGLQRDAYQTNLTNSTKSYNTALEDRIRARYHTEGRASGDVDTYLRKHAL